MSSKKRCWNCGQWSAWDTTVNDTCEHCGALLDPEGRKKREKEESEAKRKKETWMFQVRPGDPTWKIVGKKIGYVWYVVFMAIVSLVAWIIAVIPG